jgi:hypothetical protein
MCLSAWYYHNAAQCAQMARDAVDPQRCVQYQQEQELWLQIAERAEVTEMIEGHVVGIEPGGERRKN